MRNSLLLVGLGLMLLAVGLSVWAYPLLPEVVPSHWDLAGHVNGYLPRFIAVAIVPAIAVLTSVLAIVLPAISPRNYRFGGAVNEYYEAMIAVLAMLVAVHFLLLRAEIMGKAPPIALIFALIGLLLAALGVLIGKVPKNFFMGIRTPWTLANDEVWLRTNRLASRLMVVGGLAIVVLSVLPPAWMIGAFVAIILIAALVPIVYSYALYKRIEGFGSD
jgi:uncharacterized membrane protein